MMQLRCRQHYSYDSKVSLAWLLVAFEPLIEEGSGKSVEVVGTVLVQYCSRNVRSTVE